jgi:hypothetical protein
MADGERLKREHLSSKRLLAAHDTKLLRQWRVGQ